MVHAMHIGSKTCQECGAPLAPTASGAFCGFCLARTSLLEDESLGLSGELNHVLPRSTSGEAVAFGLGDYDLIEPIATGGMGAVWKARQRSVGRIVAVKMILFGGFASPDLLERFRREALAGAALNHPNIARVIDAGEHEGQPFLVMEYIEGESLAQRLARQPLSAREAANCLQKVALAIEFAHSKGVLHRDLKPSNVLLDLSGEPHVTDFGLARMDSAPSDLTLSAQALGTPSYMPPEQTTAGAKNADRPGDVYGLGAILYHCLTGHPPFQAATIGEVLLQVREKEPVAPRVLNPAIPRDLDTICLKCLQKNPERRYGSAGEVARELGRFLNNEPIVARPISALERAARWCHRNRSLAASLSFLLLLLLVIAVASPLAAYRINRERERAEIFAGNESEQRQQAQAHAYTSDMNLAWQAWDEGNLRRAREFLSAHIPKNSEVDMRGFEWRYLWYLCQDVSLLTVPLGPGGPIGNLARTPAHSFVAANTPEAILLLDPFSGATMARLPLPAGKSSNPFASIALAQGKTNLLAAHTAGGVVHLWDTASQQLTGSFRLFETDIAALALSANGKLLAAGDDHTYKATLGVWEISPGLKAATPLWRESSTGNVTRLAFSPDGEFLAVARGYRSLGVRVWDAVSGEEQRSIPHVSAGNIYAFTFSPDGSLLAVSGVEGRIKILDFAARREKYVFDGHSGSVDSLAFSADGRRLISGGADQTIRLWDVPAQKAAGVLRSTGTGSLLAVFAPGDKLILSSAESEIKLWRAEAREPAQTISAGTAYGHLGFSPDDRWLIATDGVGTDSEHNGAQVWDFRAGKLALQLRAAQKEPFGYAFSPVTKVFAMGDVDVQGIALWNTERWENGDYVQEPIRYLETGFETGSLAFSPDGKTLAAAGLCFFPREPSSATNRLAFFDTTTWEKLNVLEEAGVGPTAQAAAADVRFSHDGELLALGYRDGWVRLWHWREKRLIRALKRHEDNWVGALVRFSPDDRWLVSFPKGFFNLSLYDLTDRANPKEVATFRPSSGKIWDASIAPDNKTLVTHTSDGLIKFWNLRTLKVALTLRHGRGPGGALAFSHDGELLASEDGHGVIKLWTAPSLQTIHKNPFLF